MQLKLNSLGIKERNPNDGMFALRIDDALIPPLERESWDAETEPHITLVYVDDARGIEGIPEDVLDFIDGKQPPLVLDWLDIWQVPWEDETRYCMILRPSQCPDWLHELQAGVIAHIESLGIEYSKYSIPDNYKPHVTLGYSSVPITDLPVIAPVVIPFEHIALQLHKGDEVAERIPLNNSAWDMQEIIERLIVSGYITPAEAGLESNPIKAFLSKHASGLRGIDDEIPFVERESGFKVLGNNRWIAWYTNSYKDVEDEIFPLSEIKHDVDYMNRTKNYPELWFSHMRGTKHGQANAVIIQGRFAIAVGTFDDTPLAHKLKEFYKKHPRKLSHGFWYDKATKKDGIYGRFHTYEISTLKIGREANRFTGFGILKENGRMEPNTEQITELVKALGGGEKAGEMALSILKEANVSTKSLDAAGIQYKAIETIVPVEQMGSPVQVETSMGIEYLRSSVEQLQKAVSLLQSQQAQQGQPPPPAPNPNPAPTPPPQEPPKEENEDERDLKELTHAMDVIQKAKEKFQPKAAGLPNHRRAELLSEQAAFEKSAGYGQDGKPASEEAAIALYGEAGYKALSNAGLASLIMGG